MKKILTVVIGFLLITLLTACPGSRYRNAPDIFGVLDEYRVAVGQTEFDPLEGVTATDAVDGDLTYLLKHTFKKEWLSSTGGTHTYSVSVTNSDDQEAVKDSKIVIGDPRISINNVRYSQTYYLGSRAYDPTEGVRVSYKDDSGNFEDITDQLIFDIDDLPTSSDVNQRIVVPIRVEHASGEIAEASINLQVFSEFKGIASEVADGTVIELWHSNGDTIADLLKQFAVDFVAEMAEKGVSIQVNIEKPASDYDALKDAVAGAIAEGNAPQIIQGYPDHMIEYRALDAIEPMTPYIFHPVHGLNATGKDSFGEVQFSYLKENSDYGVTGEFFSMPFNKSTEVMIYNKDVVKAAGYDSIPETWQDLMVLSKKLNEMGSSQLDAYSVIRGWTAEELALAKSQFVPMSVDSHNNAMITYLRQWGGGYTSRNASGQGVLGFANGTIPTQELKNMATFFNTQSKNKNLTLPANWIGNNYASDLMKEGKTFISIGSTGGARYNAPSLKVKDDISSGALYEYGVAPIPYNADTGIKAAIQQGTNFSIIKDKKNTDNQKLLSWLFIKYLMSAEVQVKFAMETGYNPVTMSAYEEENFKKFLSGINPETGAALTDYSKKVIGTENDPNIPEKAGYIGHLMNSRAILAGRLQSDYQFYDTPFSGSAKVRGYAGEAFSQIIFNDASKIDEILAAFINDSRRAIGGN